MDAMDLLTGGFRTTYPEDPPRQEYHLEQEEKHEDNPSSSSSSSSASSSDDEPEQDMDFPTTQVLVQESADVEVGEMKTAMQNVPRSPAAIHSPVKSHASPIKPRNSPVRSRASPVTARTPVEMQSPVKMRTPVKMQSPVKMKSPVKMQSPVKMKSPVKAARSPAKMRSPVKAGRSPVKSVKPSVTPAAVVESRPTAEKKAEDSDVDNDTPEEFRVKGPAGKFTKVFPAIAKLVENGGWQIAEGHNTLFCAMPGVQFFNFKPNINVFDSKIKACWKFIQIAGEKNDDSEDKELWDMLWPIAEKQFGWFTMLCGPETWFVKPNTKFENFRPNETIFQTKKRAVLKCLAVEVGDIELGDSAEGHQVIAFGPREVPASAPKKAKTALFKTPSPAVKTVKRSTPTAGSTAKFITPAKRLSPGSAVSSVKRKLSSSTSKLASKTAAAKKKVKGAKNGAKKTTTRKKKKPISDTASDISKGDEFNFTPPEFRSSFGIVYARLQDEGWYHKSGMFEYDYFSPTYTDATKELNVNYFRSQADLEDFLKVSGTWKRIEDDLRDEHEQAVDVEREKALDRHHQRLEQQAARKRNLALYGAPTLIYQAAPKPKKVKKSAPKKTVVNPPVAQSLYQAEVEAAQAAEAEEARLSRMPKMKFGTVLKKLISRGWYYRPGRFEYDYFKPSANPRTAVAGEDRFESAAALEVYLKTTGLWEEIAAEVTREEGSKPDNYPAPARVEYVEPPAKRAKLESPPPESAQSRKTVIVGGVRRDEVNAITDDIWANSHEFDFNE